jgi:hypothetical protein
MQKSEFRAEFCQQTGRGSLLAHMKAHAAGSVDAFGKRA